MTDIFYRRDFRLIVTCNKDMGGDGTTLARLILTVDAPEVEAMLHRANTQPGLVEALELAAKELAAIRARSGAPVAIEWGPKGPMQTLLCTEEWWDELTEKCFAALTAAGESP